MNVDRDAGRTSRACVRNSQRQEVFRAGGSYIVRLGDKDSGCGPSDVRSDGCKTSVTVQPRGESSKLVRTRTRVVDARASPALWIANSAPICFGRRHGSLQGASKSRLLVSKALCSCLA